MTSRERGPSLGIATGAVGAVCGSFTALMLASSFTRATHVDPTQPATLVVGPSPGLAPMARIDGERRGRSHLPLPDRPTILWRRVAGGGLERQGLAVDDRGSIVLPSSNLPEVVQLDADGRVQWRSSTGAGPAVTGPVILGDGTRVVVSSAGDAIGFSPDGSHRFASPLDLSERNARLTLLPLQDGGFAVAGGHEMLEVDPNGRPRARTHLDERIAGPLLATRTGIVATTGSGSVHLLRTGYSKRLGTVGGDPGDAGASTADGRTLLAVVDHQRMVAMDLASGTTQVRFSVSDLSLHGPVGLGRGDAAVLTTWMGILIVLSPSPAEQRRTALEPPIDTLITDAGNVDFAALEESPPPVSDEDGRIAFARVGGRVGVVATSGTVSSVRGSTCNSPVGLAPAGRRRFVVTCRDGGVFLIADEAP